MMYRETFCVVTWYPILTWTRHVDRTCHDDKPFTVTLILVQVSSLQFVLQAVYSNKGTDGENVKNRSVSRHTFLILLLVYLLEMTCFMCEKSQVHIKFKEASFVKIIQFL